MRALCIVPTRHEAREQGMNEATCAHRGIDGLRFWWPGLSTERLRGCQFDLIAIAPAAHRHMNLRCWQELSAYVIRPGTVVIGAFDHDWPATVTT